MRLRTAVLLSTMFVVALLFVGVVFATSLALNPGLTMSGQGLTVAEGGVGLEDRAFPATISVPIGGPVQRALLYWAGRDFDCAGGTGDCQTPFPYKDQELIFEGTPVTGEIIGTEEYVGSLPRNNIGYRIDVTSIVQNAFTGAGTYNFSLEDGNTDLDLGRFNGAGLIVIYEDESDPASYEIQIYEGLDYAFSGASGENQVTELLEMTYASRSQDVAAELIIFTGDGTASRPDTVTIDGTDYYNTLTGQDGESFDTQVYGLTIPANTTQTSVQLFSETNPELSTTPDSLLWELAVLRIPTTTPTAVTLSNIDISSGVAGAGGVQAVLIVGVGLAIVAYVRRRAA